MESNKQSKREASCLENHSTDGQLPNDDASQSHVSKLPDDCLISIFSLLSIVDRVKIQRVCKRWRSVSLMSWSTCKTLTFKDEEWGFKNLYSEESVIDLIVLKKVLKLCGPYVTRIDFSDYVHSNDGRKRFRTSKKLFSLIIKLCPNLTGLDITGLSVTSEGIVSLGQIDSNLTEFRLETYEYFEPALSNLFDHHQNFRRLILEVPISEYCLQYLNPATVEEISLLGNPDATEYFCTALKSFINLRSFSIQDRFNFNHKFLGYINELLKAIKPHSGYFKELNIHSSYIIPVDDVEVEIHTKHFECFRNLERLTLEGSKIKLNENFFKTVTKYCSKLTYLKLTALTVTDPQVESIVKLPELRELHLSRMDEITDAIFLNRMPKLKKLVCYYCEGLGNFGLHELLRESSKSLQSLEVKRCENVNVKNLIQCAKESVDSRAHGPLLKMTVPSTELGWKPDRVTKLSKHFELTEYSA